MKKNNWQDKIDEFIGDVIDSLHTRYSEEDGIDAAFRAVETARDYKRFLDAYDKLDTFIAFIDGICDHEKLFEEWFAFECGRWIRTYAVALKFAGYR